MSAIIRNEPRDNTCAKQVLKIIEHRDTKKKRYALQTTQRGVKIGHWRHAQN